MTVPDRAHSGFSTCSELLSEISTVLQKINRARPAGGGCLRRIVVSVSGVIVSRRALSEWTLVSPDDVAGIGVVSQKELFNG